MKTIQVYHYGELPNDARREWRRIAYERFMREYEIAGFDEGEIMELISKRMEGEAARAQFVKLYGGYYELAKNGYPMPDLEA